MDTFCQQERFRPDLSFRKKPRRVRQGENVENRGKKQKFYNSVLAWCRAPVCSLSLSEVPSPCRGDPLGQR